MKKKSIAARLGVMAVALTLATTSLTSGTLAKYVTEASFKAKAMVAAWNPDLAVKQGENYVYNWQSSFDALDLSLADTKTSANYAVYNKKIAPGMEGAINLQVSNFSKKPESGDTPAATAQASEVDTKFIVYINADNPANAPTNLKFSYGASAVSFDRNKDHTDYGWKLTEGTLKGNSTLPADAQKDLAIKWSWPYENTTEGATEDDKANYDADDVRAGEAALTTTYTITVVMTQANPKVANDVNPNPLT